MTIRRRLMPGTPFELSVISLGTDPLGGVVDEDESFRLLDAYVELGGNFIDTAESYSTRPDVEPSLAEKRIGRWLSRRGLADEVVVATKGGYPRPESPDRMRLGPDELRADLEGSIERLGIEPLPLWYLHRDDPERPVREIMGAVAEFVAEGRVRFVGCSNWRADRIREAVDVARENDLQLFVADQMRWSLANLNQSEQRIPGLVEMDNDLWELHRDTGLAAVAYSSQAKGFFSGAYGRHIAEPDARNAEKVERYYYNETNFDRLERVETLARQLGRPPTHVALGYLLNQPFPVYATVGTSRVDHLRESCAAADLDLTRDQIRWLRTGR